MTTTTRYEIRVGHPWQPITPDSVLWGWCRTEDAARRRAVRLSRIIRTDCAVGIVYQGRIIAATGVHSGPGGGQTRPLVLVERR